MWFGSWKTRTGILMMQCGQRSSGGLQHDGTHSAVGWNCSDRLYIVERLKTSAPKCWMYEACSASDNGYVPRVSATNRLTAQGLGTESSKPIGRKLPKNVPHFLHSYYTRTNGLCSMVKKSGGNLQEFFLLLYAREGGSDAAALGPHPQHSRKVPCLLDRDGLNSYPHLT